MAPPISVSPAGTYCSNTAAADAEIERLIQPFAAVFEQYVLAGDTEIGGAILNVGRHIGRAQDDERNAGNIGCDDQLARRSWIFGCNQPCPREQGQRFIEKAPLGERESKRGHAAAKRRMSSPPILSERAHMPRVGACDRSRSSPARRRTSYKGKLVCRTCEIMRRRRGPMRAGLRHTWREWRGRRPAPAARRARRRYFRHNACGSR